MGFVWRESRGEMRLGIAKLLIRREKDREMNEYVTRLKRCRGWP